MMQECNDTKTIGKRIRKLREECQMTQEQVGNALLVKRQTVSQWENGERDLKTEQIIKLANLFHVSCDQILTGYSPFNIYYGEELGLSDKAISNLRKLCELNTFNMVQDFITADDLNFYSDTLKVISKVIEDMELCYLLKDYCRTSSTDFTHITNYNDSIPIPTDETTGRKYLAFRDNSYNSYTTTYLDHLNNSILLEIMKHIKQLVPFDN